MQAVLLWVKLYGPDSDALSTYANELHMYSAMAAVQGNLLPVLLGAGHLAAGVHFKACG